MTTEFTAAVDAAVGERTRVVALGGGADSAMLLHAALGSSNGASVQAVFANHALDSSELLKQSAMDLTAYLGVPLTIVDAMVTDGPDLEIRARNARYEAIEAVIGTNDVGLTGHTADDQAETVLMRLMRGSGAGGLAGIPAVRGVWHRPFLSFRRTDLRSEVVRLSLPFVDDPANTDDRFLRSRIRHHLLPEIERTYAPGIADDLIRTATLLANDDALLSSMSDQIPITELGGHITLPVAAILASPNPVASRSVRTALRRCGDVYPGSMTDIETALGVARTGSAAMISGNIRVSRQSALLVFQVDEPTSSHDPVIFNGGEAFRWNGDTYDAAWAVAPTATRTAGRFSVIAANSGHDPFAVRGVREGDRLDIGTGSTPVTEILRNGGVPPMQRPLWPVISCGDRIAAVHGVRTAAWAQPRNGDKVLVIEREVRT